MESHSKGKISLYLDSLTKKLNEQNGRNSIPVQKKVKLKGEPSRSSYAGNTLVGITPIHMSQVKVVRNISPRTAKTRKEYQTSPSSKAGAFSDARASNKKQLTVRQGSIPNFSSSMQKEEDNCPVSQLQILGVFRPETPHAPVQHTRKDADIVDFLLKELEAVQKKLFTSSFRHDVDKKLEEGSKSPNSFKEDFYRSITNSPAFKRDRERVAYLVREIENANKKIDILEFESQALRKENEKYKTFQASSSPSKNPLNISEDETELQNCMDENIILRKTNSELRNQLKKNSLEIANLRKIISERRSVESSELWKGKFDQLTTTHKKALEQRNKLEKEVQDLKDKILEQHSTLEIFKQKVLEKYCP